MSKFYFIEEIRKDKIDYEIIVKNVEEKNKNVILCLFEDKERSGGGKARSFSYNEVKKELTIEYEEKSSTDNSVKFRGVELQGKVYRAYKKKHINSFDNCKLKIKIFSDHKTELKIKIESIRLYIESKLLLHSNFDLYEYDYNIDDSLLNEGVLVYLMISKSEFDYDQILELFYKKPTISEKKVLIEQIKFSNILVKLAPDCKYNYDDIHNYFTSERISGGGSIKIFKKIMNYYFIEFENKSCVEKVLTKNHDSGIKVFPYFDDNVEFFQFQLSFNKTIKICPQCTTRCDLCLNYCKSCDYQFKFNSLNQPKEINTLKKKCPICTMVAEADDNYCYACNHEFLKSSQITDENFNDKSKTCPICTMVAEADDNYCYACQHEFLKSSQITDENFNDKSKKCPICTTVAEAADNYCSACQHEFLKSSQITDENFNDNLKTCPICTMVAEADDNYCSACQHEFL